jgi:hypothetical protein
LKYILAFISILFLQPSAPAALYVAPYGQGGVCDIDAPCTLQSVIGAGSVPPGETVYLLPGTYTGAFQSFVSGTQESPITFRSVPGTRVTIDGSLRIDGTDTTWKGMEIRYTGWTSRTVPLAGSNPPGMPVTGLHIYGARTHIQDCYVHDTAYGIGAWSTATDAVIEGCLIANNGWQGTDKKHGHAIYAQNGVGVKVLRNNLILPHYDIGLHVYGSAAASLTGFDVDGNVIVNSPSLIGGGSPAGRVQVRNNVVSGSSFDLGYWNVENNQDATVTGNTFATTLLMSGWYTATVTGNTFEGVSDQLRIHYPPAHTRYAIDQNSYACPFGSCLSHTVYTTGNRRSFSAWKAETGYDAGSTLTLNTAGTPRVLTRGRFFIVLNGATVIDPQGLTPGAAYKLVNAQNPSEALPFTAGTPITLPSGWTVQAPYGATAPLIPTFVPVFYVEAA